MNQEATKLEDLCEACCDSKWPGILVPVNAEQDRFEVQRCDECDLYPDDVAAAHYLSVFLFGFGLFTWVTVDDGIHRPYFPFVADKFEGIVKEKVSGRRLEPPTWSWRCVIFEVTRAPLHPRCVNPAPVVGAQVIVGKHLVQPFSSDPVLNFRGGGWTDEEGKAYVWVPRLEHDEKRACITIPGDDLDGGYVEFLDEEEIPVRLHHNHQPSELDDYIELFGKLDHYEAVKELRRLWTEARELRQELAWRAYGDAVVVARGR